MISTAVLIALGLFLTLWTLMPPLLSLAGFTRFDCSVSGTPFDLEPGGGDLAYKEVYRQLRELGFQPLGYAWEAGRFFGPHWRWRCRKRVFGSTTGAFAYVYRFFPLEPPRVAFGSLVGEEIYVWTDNRSGERCASPEHIHESVQSENVGEVLDYHRELVDALVSRGKQRPSTTDLETARAFDAFSMRSALTRQAIESAARTVLAGYAIFGLCAIVLVYFWIGPGQPWTVRRAGVAVLACGASVTFGYYLSRILLFVDAVRRGKELGTRLRRSHGEAEY